MLHVRQTGWNPDHVASPDVLIDEERRQILDGEFAPSIGKTALASLVMWGVILLIDLLIPWDTAGHLGARLIYLALCVTAGGAAFFAAAHLLKSPDMAIAVGALRRRIVGRGKE